MKPQRTTGSMSNFDASSLAMDGWSRRSVASRRTRSTLMPWSRLRPKLSMTPMKMALGASALAALIMTLAIQRLPGETRMVVEKPTIREAQPDAAWADNFQQAVAKKQDRVRVIEMASTDSKPVVTERIVPPTDASTVVPPVVMVQEDKPASRGRRHYAERTRSGGDVCSRHGMHKQVTRGGKSWRCKR